MVFSVQHRGKKKEKITFQLFEAKVNNLSGLFEILNVVKIECDYLRNLEFISLICFQQDRQRPNYGPINDFGMNCSQFVNELFPIRDYQIWI